MFEYTITVTNSDEFDGETFNKTIKFNYYVECVQSTTFRTKIFQ